MKNLKQTRMSFSLNYRLARIPRPSISPRTINRIKGEGIRHGKNFIRKNLLPELKKNVPIPPAIVDTIAEHVMSHGENIIHGLGKKSSESGPGIAPLPLKGFAFDNYATASTTRSLYKSRLAKPSRISGSMKMLQRYEWITSSSYRLLSTIGAQAWGDWSTSGAGTQYNDAVYGGTNCVAAGAGTYTVKPGALRYINDSIVATNATALMYHRACNVQTTITNFTGMPVQVDVYELVAKRDLQTSADIYGIESNAIWSPGAFWAYGLSEAQTPGVGSPVTNLTIGSYPTDSQLFNQYWNVASRFQVNLSSGGSHVHDSVYTLNKVIDGLRIRNAALLQGITRNILVIVKGVLVTDTSHDVSIGAASIGVKSYFTYKTDALAASQLVTAVTDVQTEVTVPLTLSTDAPTSATPVIQ